MQVVAARVSKAYGFLWALQDVSVTLAGGEFVILVGPNGAGKTTLLKVLALLLEPTSGEVQWNGRKNHRGSSEFRSAIGFFSPSEHLYDNLTAKENLCFFTALYGKKKRPHDIEECLERVALSARRDHRVSFLSAGMKSRLSIAKWMLLEPELFLLDEPYATLDQSGAHLLDSYLVQLVRNGGVVVMATHQPSRAVALSTRAIALDSGKVVFDEPRQEPWKSLYQVCGEPSFQGSPWSS